MTDSQLQWATKDAWWDTIFNTRQPSPDGFILKEIINSIAAATAIAMAIVEGPVAGAVAGFAGGIASAITTAIKSPTDDTVKDLAEFQK